MLNILEKNFPKMYIEKKARKLQFSDSITKRYRDQKNTNSPYKKD